MKRIISFLVCMSLVFAFAPFCAEADAADVTATLSDAEAEWTERVYMYITLEGTEQYLSGGVEFNVPKKITVTSGKWTLALDEDGLNVTSFKKADLTGVFALDMEEVELPDASEQYGRVFRLTVYPSASAPLGDYEISFVFKLKTPDGRDLTVDCVPGTLSVVCRHTDAEYVCDAEGHSLVCPDCEATLSSGAHVYGDTVDAVCDVCGYERELPAVVTGYEAGSGEWSYDTGSDALTVTSDGGAESISAGGAPWASRAASIKSVTVGEGVTALGADALSSLTALETVIFTGAPVIESGAFDAVPGVTVKGFTASPVDTYCADNGIAFEGIEEFDCIGYQLANTAKNKFRVIAQMNFAENYVAAGYEVRAVGDDGKGHSFDKFLDKRIAYVYTSIRGTNSSGAEETVASAPEGRHLSAISFSGLPEVVGDGSITFTVTPYVINGYSGEKIYMDPTNVVYPIQ